VINDNLILITWFKPKIFGRLRVPTHYQMISLIASSRIKSTTKFKNTVKVIVFPSLNPPPFFIKGHLHGPKHCTLTKMQIEPYRVIFFLFQVVRCFVTPGWPLENPLPMTIAKFFISRTNYTSLKLLKYLSRHLFSSSLFLDYLRLSILGDL
jgi:hypothetical protein